MSLQDDLNFEIAHILQNKWTERDGNVVPDTVDLQLSNDAVKLDAVVLYADLADSTNLVNQHPPWFAAELYKSFLICAARVIRAEGGEITAYDGDRVMAVFLHQYKNTAAARTALKINYAVTKMINPAFQRRYPDRPYAMRHVVGVDASKLWVSRTGIRGSNDLVWIGRSANYAAKLSAFNEGYMSYVTDTVFNNMSAEVCTSTDGRPMWERRHWSEKAIHVYRSNWTWTI